MAASPVNELMMMMMMITNWHDVA